MGDAPTSEEAPDDRGVVGFHHDADRLLKRARLSHQASKPGSSARMTVTT